MRMLSPEERDRCRRNLAEFREAYRWERTLRPLIDFCRDGGVSRAEKRSRVLPIAYRGLDWAASEAHEKLRFAYRKKLLRSGHSGLR